MSMWLDAKYVSMLSSRLRNFKRKNTNLWNFSCPICGDSKDNKYRARGYVYPYKGALLFHCHKCFVTLGVPKFIQTLDMTLYDEYLKEKLLDAPREKTDLEVFVDKMKPPKFQALSPLKTLKKVSSLDPNHPVKKYVVARGIPSEYHFKLYLTMGFKTWVNTIIPDKFESIKGDEPRLVIPFIDPDGNLFGFQGRSFKPDSKLRYITIMLDERPKIFNWDTVNTQVDILVVEGPIDAMFLPNSIAAAGGDMTTDLPLILDNPKRFTIIYDCEPRSIFTVRKMEKAIAKGYNVCIWPQSMVEKDINDMVTSGITSEKLVAIIQENTYNDLYAEIALAAWRKC